tara:strand:- start:102 stop:914 length:813 start_codon:yes stop_codon:yes gene_type:complete
MKKLFTILCAAMLTIGLSAQTEAGTFYMSLGNAYSPMGEMQSGPFSSIFSNSSGMSFGNEWITGITVDGDDDDDNGNDYWDKNEKSSTGNFNISGQFGFFVADGLLTGLGIEYASLTMKEEYESDFDGDGQDDEYTSKSSLSSFALSPFVKYYIPLGDNSLFVSSSYTFGSINSKWEEGWDYTSSPNQDDDDEGEPYKTSRLEFGTGMAFFLTESISLEPSVNFALNTYTQEQEVYIGSDPITGNSIYDDQDRKVSTNAFYFKIAASMYF